jgi:hypothetical protein
MVEIEKDLLFKLLRVHMDGARQIANELLERGWLTVAYLSQVSDTEFKMTVQVHGVRLVRM